MSESKSKWRRRILVFVATTLAIVICAGIYLNGYVTPTVREKIDSPLYTVGDSNYEAALSDGKNIVKFGRLPFGIYPGGVAFDDPDKARRYIEKLGKEGEGWKVYRLSGDYERDTVAAGEMRFTRPSLLVLEVVRQADSRLSLDYDAFDQTPNSGWRVLAEEKKYLQAASLIVAYQEANSELPIPQQRVLYFHAGQMYAFADKNELAIEKFELSRMDVEPPESPIRWNAYVNATIAFLQNDKESLVDCREEIFNGPKFGDVTPNLDVVDSLIEHLGKPYSVAYESQRGMGER